MCRIFDVFAHEYISLQWDKERMYIYIKMVIDKA